MNELAKLRQMLDNAEIPYESYQEMWSKEDMLPAFISEFGAAGKYKRNQVIYGKHDIGGWKIDGVCHYGSYGAGKGLIETYGELGTDETGEPMVLTAQEVFDIIKKDWEKENK